jgi:hypothetical protein
MVGAALAALAAGTHDAGAWVHRGWDGVSAGRVGEGWAHAGWGGVTEGRAGEGWAHEGYGGVTYGYHGDVTTVHNTYVGGAYPVGGCYSCGAAAAAVGGLAVGAAVGAAAASATTPSTVVVQQPVIVTSPAVGSMVTSLPSGCTGATVGGTQYYGCNGTYYKPKFGSNGVYYVVVANPF